MRKNGFQWPWHPYQVLSWVAFVVFVIAGVYLVGMVVPTPFNIIFYIISAAMELSIVLLTIFTTVIDPADDFKDANVDGTVMFSLKGGQRSLLFCLSKAGQGFYGALPSLQQVCSRI